MSRSEVVFRIAKNKRCPCYETGEEFRLSGNALLLELEKEKTFISTAVITPPFNKRTCRTLLADLTRSLIEYGSVDRIPAEEIPCSGCTGMVHVMPRIDDREPAGSTQKSRSDNIDIIAGLLSNFSIFQSLDRHNLRDIVSLLKVKKYPSDRVILKKGAPAQNLYIILSGEVDVLDEEGVCLSTLRKGDVFGEMSLISGNPVGATVKVVQPATVIFIRGQDFRRVLNRYPSIQMYLARLLAQRLEESNLVRAEEIASGMAGRLAEMPPSELAQTLNLNQKTGILSLTLPGGPAELIFRNGDLVKARYNDEEGQEAFFAILSESEGRFQFHPKLSEEEENLPVLGAFMEILLDGLRRMDEAENSGELPGEALI
jgi:CRP-like cAMP-binding protein